MVSEPLSHAAPQEAPGPTAPEALMAERQKFWATCCWVAVRVVAVIAVLLVVLDLLLL